MLHRLTGTTTPRVWSGTTPSPYGIRAPVGPEVLPQIETD